MSLSDLHPPGERAPAATPSATADLVTRLRALLDLMKASEAPPRPRLVLIRGDALRQGVGLSPRERRAIHAARAGLKLVGGSGA